jgi:RNA polymerase sigma-70 factor (ECF subfamily)
MRPDINLLNKELNKKIFEAVDKLPEKQKKTVVLREVEDLSYNEIAEIMGCSVGTVMSRLYYARERLRNILEPYVKDGS